MRFSVAALTIPSVMMALACGSDPTPPPAAPMAPIEEPPPAPVAEPSKKPGDDPSKASINFSDEIKRACGISDADAHFAFNSAFVRESDRRILGKVAKCFNDGPLKGRRMRLVGHADPRGEDEYNMLLGERRAGNVKGAIANEGLNSDRMETTSRGELDATGTEEASWAQDRRVDVSVAD